MNEQDSRDREKRAGTPEHRITPNPAPHSFPPGSFWAPRQIIYLWGGRLLVGVQTWRDLEGSSSFPKASASTRRALRLLLAGRPARIAGKGKAKSRRGQPVTRGQPGRSPGHRRVSSRPRQFSAAPTDPPEPRQPDACGLRHGTPRLQAPAYPGVKPPSRAHPELRRVCPGGTDPPSPTSPGSEGAAGAWCSGPGRGSAGPGAAARRYRSLGAVTAPGEVPHGRPGPSARDGGSCRRCPTPRPDPLPGPAPPRPSPRVPAAAIAAGLPLPGPRRQEATRMRPRGRLGDVVRGAGPAAAGVGGARA